MRVVKSERLKKMETELADLQEWLKLGLVPKRDIDKHKEEILTVQRKIEEEKERLHFLRESGEGDEALMPRKPTRSGFTDMPTIPDIDMQETAMGFTEAGTGGAGGGYETESETTLSGNSSKTQTEIDDEPSEAAKDEKEEVEDEEEEEESYFSDRNRWKRGGRGGIIDPDADEW